MSTPNAEDGLRPEKEGSSMRSVLSSSIPRSPGSGTMKAVQIADPPESISPLMRGSSKDVDDFSLDRSVPRQHRTKISSSRLTGRPAMAAPSRSSRGSIDTPLDGGAESGPTSRPASLHDAEGLASRITAWIQREKHRRSKRRAKRGHRKKKRHVDEDEDVQLSDSDASSEGSVALENLQDILNRSLNLSERPPSRKALSLGAKKPSRAKLRRPSAASDTEYTENEDLVPTCDVILDNTKVCSNVMDSEVGEDAENRRPSLNRTSSSYQKDAWKSFKYEIVRLTHTLRLRGWRRVPMQMSDEIEVIRLSGALTNAVYEVLPPNELPARTTDTVDGTCSAHPKSKPQKLLLRIYGVGVDNLIDREAELQILRRLRRKNIGPRLLGCFSNGRFEEFLHAKALTAAELKDGTISVQIAKRMRELHQGMDLLPLEREEGSFVWCSIGRWQKYCERIVGWLDTKARESSIDGSKPPSYVLGTEWSQFSDVINKYRDWLSEQYGGTHNLKNLLVFAHNDTQYGNILRMTPEGESPLLTPANQHKRLLVIDFEYANANMVGYEFANHFTEWCYNYHDENAPHAINTKLYPTWEEQRRFIHAYLTHDPKFPKTNDDTSAQPSGPATPSLGPTTTSLSTSLISNFMLDARNPQSGKDVSSAPEEETERELENEISRLQHETRLWRLSCSAFWAMWGVQRAKIPDLPDFDDPTQSAAVAAGPTLNISMSSGTLPLVQSPIAEEDGLELDADTSKATEGSADTPAAATKNAEAQSNEEDEEEEDEFDYLGYSYDRAMFFWGDAVNLGLVKKHELPEEVQKNMRLVDV